MMWLEVSLYTGWDLVDEKQKNWWETTAPPPPTRSTSSSWTHLFSLSQMSRPKHVPLIPSALISSPDGLKIDGLNQSKHKIFTFEEMNKKAEIWTDGQEIKPGHKSRGTGPARRPPSLTHNSGEHVHWWMLGRSLNVTKHFHSRIFMVTKDFKWI